MIENNFSKKLFFSESLAESRNQVINELSDQIKSLVNTTATAGDNGRSEIEDLKAELCMARSNWAATRDELLRLQFNANSTDRPDTYPAPIIALLDSSTEHRGLIAAIRNVRDVRSNVLSRKVEDN
jgi:hypothetical protein